MTNFHASNYLYRDDAFDPDNPKIYGAWNRILLSIFEKTVTEPAICSLPIKMLLMSHSIRLTDHNLL